MAASSVAFNVGLASIGAESWRRDVKNDVRLSQQAIKKADRHINILIDPTFLPHLKDMVIEKANYTALDYMRNTRQVINRLREMRNAINDRLKVISKHQNAIVIEKENIQAASGINYRSRMIRATRPNREAMSDGADTMLDSEQLDLTNIMASLDGLLQRTRDYSLRMGALRDRMDRILRERQRVTDLIPNTAASSHNKSRSAPLRQSAPNADDILIRMQTPCIVDPLGPYTVHCDQAMNDARDVLQQSKDLEQDSRDVLQRCRQRLQTIKQMVNESIDKKIAESVAMSQKLHAALGENRGALHRSQRYYDKIEHAYLDSVGPERYSNVSTGDRLDRPVIRVYQRHPGNISADAVELIKARTGLVENMQKCSYQIGELQLTQLQMSDNLRDKRCAIQTDGDVVRLRRRLKTMPAIKV